MTMNRALTLGRLFGIEFRIHFSWFIVFILVTASLVYPRFWDWTYWLIAIISSILLFSSVVAHELAHSLVGRANGIPISSITLFIFGGVAQMTEEAPRPGAEFRMAAAGPLCSLVLSAIFWLSLLIPDIPQPLGESLFWLALSNLSLAVFNLVPGFPLDGGRIFRAALWRFTGNYRRASLIAARLGQGIGFLLVTAGILAMFFHPFGMTWFDGIWFAFIGWFLVSAATASYQQVIIREEMLKAEAQANRISGDNSL